MGVSKVEHGPDGTRKVQHVVILLNFHGGLYKDGKLLLSSFLLLDIKIFKFRG